MARALSLRAGPPDYLHVDVGNNWGAPSYLQPDAVRGERSGRRWRASCPCRGRRSGRLHSGGSSTPGDRRATSWPYGHAYVAGMARAIIARSCRPRPRKARDGRPWTPCGRASGSNECLHRGLVDGMRFSCAVNPSAGHELAAVERAPSPRRILVVGGGPAGLETAALAAERGHQVTLWEREDQARRPARDRGPRTGATGAFAAFIEHQAAPARRRHGRARVCEATVTWPGPHRRRRRRDRDRRPRRGSRTFPAPSCAVRRPRRADRRTGRPARRPDRCRHRPRGAAARRRLPAAGRSSRRVPSSTWARSSRRRSASTASAATPRGCSGRRRVHP